MCVFFITVDYKLVHTQDKIWAKLFFCSVIFWLIDSAPFILFLNLEPQALEMGKDFYSIARFDCH